LRFFDRGLGDCYFQPTPRGTLFVSQWFLVAGFFCFPWLYATANQLLLWNPIQASAQPAVAAWYEGGFFNLWLAPMGLATAFYLIPKLVGRPVNSQHLSLIGFWSLLLSVHGRERAASLVVLFQLGW
jgi:cbb3-type cytochrome oxidase subunit 1